MEKIKAGYLPLYIKLYDDANPGRRKGLEDYMDSMIAMIRTQGIDVIRADVCRIKEEFDAAVKKFIEEDVDVVITQHLAYSPSLESIEALLSLPVPIVVFDTTPDYELLSKAGYQSGISPNHGIHGVQDMCNLLKQNGKPYYICAGHALHSDVISRVVGMCRAATAAKFFKKERVGSVGGSFTGMGDFKISDERYKEDIGATVKYMTADVVKEFLPLVTEEEIEAEMASDKVKYASDITEDFAVPYKEATRSGLAVRKWMEAEKLDACTVNFLTLDICGLPKMPFVECCKIMERCKGYAGEGDVLTAGLIGALMHVYPETTFTEMFCPDWKENLILLSHMGESNPRLSYWKPLLADTKFNYNSCGDTVAMYNCYRPGKVVYVNLAPMKDSFTLILFEAEILELGLENGIYRHATQGWLKPCKPLEEFLTEYSEHGGTHHSAMIYGADIRELQAFGKMMGFNVVTIK